MKIIFVGTTEFGIPILEKIKDQVVLVITQPDAPTGRKKTFTPPPVKLWAEKNGIPVAQPEKISDIKYQISDINSDLLLVVAYGQIIPKDILDIPKYGSINVHGSLLPKYRGPTPIQATILNGDDTTGITLILMAKKVDSGLIVAQREVNIQPKETFTQLYARMSLESADFVARTLPDWFAGKIKPQPQNEDFATYTQLFNLNTGRIDWTKPALEVERKVRALNPEPGTWTTYQNKSVKILEAEEVADEGSVGLIGKITERNRKMVVKTQAHSLLVYKLQPEGKKIMAGLDFLNGLKDKQNAIFI